MAEQFEFTVKPRLKRRKAGQGSKWTLGGRPEEAEDAQAVPVVLNKAALQQHFHLPMHDAAKKLGVCATALKKASRKMGITTWPYRKLKEVEKRLSLLADQENKVLRYNSKLKKALEENHARLQQGIDCEIPESDYNGGIDEPAPAPDAAEKQPLSSCPMTACSTTCPGLPGSERVHFVFEDPYGPTSGPLTQDEPMYHMESHKANPATPTSAAPPTYHTADPTSSTMVAPSNYHMEEQTTDSTNATAGPQSYQMERQTADSTNMMAVPQSSQIESQTADSANTMAVAQSYQMESQTADSTNITMAVPQRYQMESQTADSANTMAVPQSYQMESQTDDSANTMAVPQNYQMESQTADSVNTMAVPQSYQMENQTADSTNITMAVPQSYQMESQTADSANTMAVPQSYQMESQTADSANTMAVPQSYQMEGPFVYSANSSEVTSAPSDGQAEEQGEYSALATDFIDALDSHLDAHIGSGAASPTSEIVHVSMDPFRPGSTDTFMEHLRMVLAPPESALARYSLYGEHCGQLPVGHDHDQAGPDKAGAPQVFGALFEFTDLDAARVAARNGTEHGFTCVCSGCEERAVVMVATSRSFRDLLRQHDLDALCSGEEVCL